MSIFCNEIPVDLMMIIMTTSSVLVMSFLLILANF